MSVCAVKLCPSGGKRRRELVPAQRKLARMTKVSRNRNRLLRKIRRLTVLVDPAYTSQECSVSGHVSPENRLTRELFSCKKCGNTSNADENAARVVLSRVRHTPYTCGLNGAAMPSEAGSDRAPSHDVAAGIPALGRGGGQLQ